MLLFAVAPVAIAQDQAQPSTADIAAEVAPSVVSIYAQRVVRARRPSLFNDPFFRRFFGEDAEGLLGPQEQTQNALGSGVIIDPRGVVVTNFHVVENTEQLRVVLNDKREYAASVILGDKRTDVAVLQLQETEEERFSSLAYRNSDNIRVGDPVMAIGNPFGVGQTVTKGIVSALARAQLGISDYQSFIQTDAAINPGNSGGALVTMDGKLLGINTAIYSRSGGSVGIGFAIPSNLVRQIVRSALDGGKIVLPWLGADTQLVSAELARSMDLARPIGVLVTAIHPQSPLARIGIIRGDVIMKVGDHEVTSPENLRYRLATLELGTRVLVQWQRQGQRRQAFINLIAPPEIPPREQALLEARHALSGSTIANLNPALLEELRLRVTQKGVVVLDVNPRSAAKRLGLRVGDIILTLNQQKITTVAQLRNLLAAGAILDLEILRGEKRLRAQLR